METPDHPWGLDHTQGAATAAKPVDTRRIHPKRLEIAAFFGHAEAVRLSGRTPRWPPPSASDLYNWGWDGTFRGLGKETALRAGVAARSHWPIDHLAAESYERRALHAAMAWAVAPDEARRKQAGRLASVRSAWSFQKVLVHMAGSRRRWNSITGLMLTGNPRYLKGPDFAAICARIPREVIPWALGERDPLAELLVAEGEAWAHVWLVPDASREPI